MRRDIPLEPLAVPRDAGIEGSDAWSRSLAGSHTSWVTDADSDAAGTVQARIQAGAIGARVEPKFRLRHDDVFFCIGSCFARSIEESLLYRGICVRSLGFRAQLDEVPYRMNAMFNKYTTASIQNELLWSLASVPFPDEALVADGDGYRDLQLHTQPAPVSLERARERRVDVSEYFGRLRDASVVIITLGLVEVWYDRLTQLYLNGTPSRRLVLQHPGRFTVHESDYRDNRERLEAVIALLARFGRRDVRVVVTVSPVPLRRTFIAEDVLVANGYSKATLRAVAGDVARRHANVQYFPSFEIVTLANRNEAYLRDELHVADAMVDLVTNGFLRQFGVEAERPYPEFEELPYLRANPDIQRAVAARTYDTGYEHWLLQGRAEGRPLRP